MKRLLFYSLVACSLAPSAKAQSYNASIFYSVSAKETAYVASVKLTTFTGILKRYSLDLDSFAGSFANGSPVAGFSLGKRFKLADQASGYLGLGVSISQGKPADWGPCLGLSFRF